MTPRCLPPIKKQPMTSIAPSKPIMPASEYAEWAPCVAGSVITSSIRPSAVMPTPIHWRRPTLKPKIRSAITASRTTPVESTAWTTDSGA